MSGIKERVVFKGQNTILNRVAELRGLRGISAAELAGRAGVSRQAMYAIEAGTYVPNTALALRLGRVLEAGIEELFHLAEEKAQRRPQLESAVWLGAGEAERGRPVELCRAGGRLMAVGRTVEESYLPVSDAVVEARGAKGNVKVRLHGEAKKLDRRLLIAGCDPAVALAAHHARAAGVELIPVHQNSSQSLALLKKGRVHIAGTHLRDAATGESNVAAVTGMFGRGVVAVISFATWREGLITASGNPKKIRGVEDLARRGVRFVNREAGAGSRLLLDTQMARLKMKPKQVRGYERLAAGHMAAAREVKTGGADCCVATEAAARVFGLEFVAMEEARYDWVLRERDVELPAVEALLNAIAAGAFRRELEGAAGYGVAVTGRRVM